MHKGQLLGPGKPGGKTSALIAFDGYFADSTLIQQVPFRAITPASFGDFLRRSGASYSSAEEAAMCIRRTSFTAEELDLIKQALDVDSNGSRFLAIRSDESTAAGVGLWHTNFVPVGGSIEQTVDVVKAILISDFSAGVCAFKERMGMDLDLNPGVLVMPVAGSQLPISPPVFGPIYHVNAIVGFTDKANMVQVGLGLGGANSLGGHSGLWCNGVAANVRFSSGHMGEALLLPKVKSVSRVTELSDITSFSMIALSSLAAELERIRKEAKIPLYIELAFNGRFWSLVQCAPVNLDKIVKPEVDQSDIVALAHHFATSDYYPFGSIAVGRKVLAASEIVYAEGDADLSGLIRGKSNYVLVIDKVFLRRQLTFENLARAAAVIDTTEHHQPIASHFSGPFREAGIPLLSAELRVDFRDELRARGTVRGDFTLWVDDSIQEGFLAKVK